MEVEWGVQGNNIKLYRKHPPVEFQLKRNLPQKKIFNSRSTSFSCCLCSLLLFSFLLLLLSYCCAIRRNGVVHLIWLCEVIGWLVRWLVGYAKEENCRVEQQARSIESECTSFHKGKRLLISNWVLVCSYIDLLLWLMMIFCFCLHKLD